MIEHRGREKFSPEDDGSPLQRDRTQPKLSAPALDQPEPIERASIAAKRLESALTRLLGWKVGDVGVSALYDLTNGASVLLDVEVAEELAELLEHTEDE